MGEREDWFRVVFEACYAPLWAYARRRATAADAEDMVAEVFTVAWRRLDDLPQGDGTLPWLYGVARRTLANQRRGHHHRTRLAARLASHDHPSGRDDQDDEPEPTAIAALERLRSHDQEILRLAAWEQLTASERGASTLGGTTSVGDALSLEPGTRLLVAGDGGFAWSCGFTQPYDPTVARQWAETFAG